MKAFEEEKISLHRIKNQLYIHTRSILGEKDYRKTAVCIPLIQTENGLAILFEQRAFTLRRQAGEICFPGGYIEPTDQSPLAAAIRETSEELDIPVDSIQPLGELDILVTHSRLIIYPYVGLLTEPMPYTPNPDEVDHLFTIELERLLQIKPDRHDVILSVQPDPNFPYHLIPNGKQYNWRTGTVTELFYSVDSHIIWGLTALILSHFLEVISTS